MDFDDHCRTWLQLAVGADGLALATRCCEHAANAAFYGTTASASDVLVRKPVSRREAEPLH